MNELFVFFVGSFVSLFSIVDPLLAVPVFVSLTERFSPEKRVQIASQASWYVFWVLVIFFIAGGLILKFFGISLEGLRIAGGLMIIGSAVEMLEKKAKLLPKEQAESESKDDIAFSPLAMPILSGPGAIAVMIGLTTDAKTWLHYPVIILVIMAVSFLCYVFLRLAHIISSKMGEATMNSFNRIMGFMLLCIGVQYIVNGVMPLLKIAFKG